MKPFHLFVCMFSAILFSACSSQNRHDVDFYYWKSRFSIGEVERGYFDALESKRLFVRVFDVDMEGGQAVPVGPVQFLHKEQLPNDTAEVVPVVFITNRTFLHYTNDDGIAKLVSNVCSGIAHFMGNAGLGYQEIQIDCDWTQRTRDAYFRFLTLLAQQSERCVSCTLRLHQVRDSKQTGVPPVAYGSLMCYATSNPLEGMTRNSILDMSLLKGYTANINDYPLPFDVIMPIYSWGIVTNHLGEVKLINGLAEDDLQKPMFEKTAENHYRVKEDGFLQGMFINAGFTVKIETITPELLAEAKDYLDKKIDRDFRWAYFHLSQGFLSRFAIDDLK